MKTKLNIVALILLTSLVSCNENLKNEIINNSDASYAASYPVSNDSFLSDVSLNINQGDKSSIPDSTFRIYCEITISEKGSIEKVELINNFLSDEVTNYLIDCIKNTKEWNPAKDKNGNLVKVKTYLPLAFQSTNYSNESSITQCDDIFGNYHDALKEFNGPFLLIIPLEGCSGCVNFSIQKIIDFSKTKTLSNTIFKNIFPVITTNSYSEKEFELRLQQAVSEPDLFYIDYNKEFATYLQDRFQPLLIKVEDQSATCEVIVANSIESTFENLEDLLRIYEASE